MLVARGKHLLFADADGASDIRCLGLLESQLSKIRKSHKAMVVGSRNQVSSQLTRKRHPLRDFLNACFGFFVKLMCGSDLQDTQCGFKLFTREAARKLFVAQHIERWAFDVELIYLAKILNIPVKEVGINWQEMPGSKVNVLLDSFKIARDILVIRLLYTLKLWSPHDTPYCL